MKGYSKNFAGKRSPLLLPRASLFDMMCRVYHVVLIVGLVSTIILMGFSIPVLAETSYFPIPAISTSKNDGRDIGLIVPILESDEEGNLKSLMVPMVIHNSFLGVRATLIILNIGLPGSRWSLSDR